MRRLVQRRSLGGLLGGGHGPGPVTDRGRGLARHEQGADHQVVEAGPDVVGPPAGVPGEERGAAPRRPPPRAEGECRIGCEGRAGPAEQVGGPFDVDHELDVRGEGELVAGVT